MVLTETRELFLCAGKQVVRKFGVRLASEGVGKEKEGDAKVPLGEYSLGKPRKSSKFGTFIPIGYPTAEQKRQGLTGGAVGIHGPHRKLEWLGSANNWFDTTDGCIGIADDERMNALSAWVEKNKPRRINIKLK